jgi:GMP synthase-like glutamine amidotransferase
VNIHYFQHAEGEGPGEIANWAAANGHNFTGTHWYRGDEAPDTGKIDFLVIMGGGMNIYQHRDYPWLVTEKASIANVLAQDKPVLGICLGGQLIADVKGARVSQAPEYEIGWYPIRVLEAARQHPFFAHFPEEFIAMHWHGDTFALPPGAMLVASTDACRNQAFLCGERTVGLQFHIEVRPEDVRTFIGGETGPLPEGRHVQSFEQILAGDVHMQVVHPLLAGLLDAMTANS